MRFGVAQRARRLAALLDGVDMPLTFLSADLSAWLFLRCGIAPSPVPFGARWLREAVDVLALDDRFAREERAGYADFVVIVVAVDRRDSPVLVDALHDRDMHAFRWAAPKKTRSPGAGLAVGGRTLPPCSFAQV